MKHLSIQHRIWLANEYAERHQVDRHTALDAVNDVHRHGKESPHYDDVMAPARERMDAIKTGFAPILEQARSRWATIKEAWAPVLEWSQTEEGQAQLAEWKREREELARVQSCNCLCQVAHGNLGVCAGEATRTLVRESESLGRVEIPVCGPCANATLARQGSTP